MKYIEKIKLENYNVDKNKLRKIFCTGYENLTTLIFYQDNDNKFFLVIAKEDIPPLILEKTITRAQAFRLMNTRV